MAPYVPATRLVGRGPELELFRRLVRDVAAGLGRAMWIEGEPGIGKSSLVAAGLSEAEEQGCRTACATADEFIVRSPLRVLLDCLGVASHSGDERHAEIMRVLHGGPVTPEPVGTEPALAAMERLLALIDNLCLVSPLIIVVDDMQWADEASLIAWHRLAQSVEQLPLLLVAVSRPLPQRPEVERLRLSVVSRDTVRISLGPLSDGEVCSLVEERVGVHAGPRLRGLAGHAAGNPLYVRELIDALRDEGKVVVDVGYAELAADAPDRAPASLASVINHRLGFLPPELLEMLGAATLLGVEFTVTDLAAVLGTPASALLTGIRQAMAAAVVTESGPTMRFRHALIRQALYDALPSALRSALHRQVAQVLAESGAPAERVAEQLLAVPPSMVDRWTSDWVAAQAAALTHKVPGLAAEMLQRVVDRDAGAEGDRQVVVVSALARAYFSMGRLEEAEKYAWHVISRSRDAEATAEMRWVLARILFSADRDEQARATVGQALRAPEVPLRWQARFRALSAMSLRADVGDLDAAEDRARSALELAEAASDPYGAGYALTVLWLTKSVRRDHPGALACIDRALSVLGQDAEHMDLRSLALDDRLFTLQNLDRLPEADAAFREVLAEAQRSGNPGRVTLHIGSAVHDYWLGRWDDALASLDSVAPDGPETSHFGLRERGPFLLYHGVAALIAVHRDDREAARRHMDAALHEGAMTISEWENYDFLLAAQALNAERNGAPERAVATLARLLKRRHGEMSLVHQWLPDLVRIAVDLEDTATARAALEACTNEAAHEARPARATFAARRCRGLLDGDPAPVMEAAEHYAAVGRPVERAQTLEDAAVLMARRGLSGEARTALEEATRIYTSIGARWGIRRADTRLRPLGIRRGVRGPRGRAAFGWEALSPTELKVAQLVAQGKSNPEAAAELFLSRRTVQTHVSHILVKIGGRSRVDIATEALRHELEPHGPDVA